MEQLDKFYALSAPIRREIIKLLADGDQLTATAIADRFEVSPPAISQHLKVLLETDIVEVQKVAQKRIYTLNALAIRELESWAHGISSQVEKFGTGIGIKNSQALDRRGS